MNLLDLAVKITCDDQASKQVDQASSGMLGKFQSMSTGAKVAIGAIATAGVAMGTAVVKGAG